MIPISDGRKAFPKYMRKESGKMVYNDKCSCGNNVAISVEESSPVVSGGNSYVIKCSKCDSAVRTISSRSMPRVLGGYAKRESY